MKILTMSQDIIRPVSNPIKETGHIQILRGDLAPEGSVAKITGKEGLYFSGNVWFTLVTPLHSHLSIFRAYIMELFVRSRTCI